MSSPATLRAPAHLVDPRARWYWTVLGLRPVVVAGVALTIWWLSSPGLPTAHVIVLVVLLVLAAVYLAVMPQWRYRVHRWEVTPDAVYTQRGWISVERRIAPISRIQTVDSERGPVEQVFRLANVTVTTASAAGPLKINGLRGDHADALVEQLTETTQATRGDAT